MNPSDFLSAHLYDVVIGLVLALLFTIARLLARIARNQEHATQSHAAQSSPTTVAATTTDHVGPDDVHHY